MTKEAPGKSMNPLRGICTDARHLLAGLALGWLVLYSQWPAAAEAARLGLEGVENADDVWDQEGAEWPRWSAHDPASSFAVDYSSWERFMADYSDRQDDQAVPDFVHVVYRGMGYLSDYIYALEKVPVSTLARDEQLAYWLNLHNAQVVKTTAGSLPSIAEAADTIRPLVLGRKWREKSLEVEGEKLSLVDIERRILMRQWKDTRVLYGLYLPARGAPGLPGTSFTGATVWKMLDDRAREFVNSERATEFHDGQLHVSALYFWDRWLFQDEAAVLDHLRTFADPPLKAKIVDVQKVAATYLNWRLTTFNSGYDRNQDRQGGS